MIYYACSWIWWISSPCDVSLMNYNDVIWGAMVSQVTSLMLFYSTVYSRRRSKKHKSSASLAFVRGIHRWPVNSPHKGPLTRKKFPFDDVIIDIRRWEHFPHGGALFRETNGNKYTPLTEGKWCESFIISLLLPDKVLKRQWSPRWFEAH